MSTAGTERSLADRLGRVRAGLRSELETSRHIFHGEPAYVLFDPLTFQSHRFTPQDYQILVSLSPEMELRQVFAGLCKAGKLSPEREEDFYRFVMTLNQLGLLTLPVSDGSALYRRHLLRRNAKKFSLMGLLFFRVPLFRPDTFLSRTLPFVAPLFTRAAFAVWLLAVLLCGVVVASNWDDFVRTDSAMLTLRNLPLLWCLLVGLKAFHELGHAYACKRFGGSVPEIGAFFIMFTPCAYVDASASWGFPQRLHRVIVGLGGMYFESIAAMVAVVVWATTEAGPVHSAAQYAIMLSTIITIGFNANPLMQYDGYHILSDLVAMPHLRRDARRQFLSMLKRGLYGIPASGPAKTLLGSWMLGLFGLASQVYRISVLTGLCVVIAFKIPAVGIAMAAVFLGKTIVSGARQVVHYVAFSPETKPFRRRAVIVTASLFAIAVWIGGLVPIPTSLLAHGVLHREREVVVHSEAPGFLVDTLVQEGEDVAAGDVIARFSNREAELAAAIKEAEYRRLEGALLRQAERSPAAAAAVTHLLRRAESELRRSREEEAALRIRASMTGRVVEYRALEEIGSYCRIGTPLACLVDGDWIIRTAIPAELFAAVRPELGERVTVWLVDGGGRPLQGRIQRISAAGSSHIDEPGLTHLAGGPIPVDSQHNAGRPFFELEIEIGRPTGIELRRGTAVQIRLGRNSRPLGRILYGHFLRILDKVRMAGW